VLRKSLQGSMMVDEGRQLVCGDQTYSARAFITRQDVNHTIFITISSVSNAPPSKNIAEG